MKELNLPKSSCKGDVQPMNQRGIIYGSDRNRTCGLFRGDCFQDSLERQPHSLPNMGCGRGVEPPSSDPQSEVITVIRPVHCWRQDSDLLHLPYEGSVQPYELLQHISPNLGIRTPANGSSVRCATATPSLDKWAWGESNSQSFRRWLLRPLCIPIPPQTHINKKGNS